MAVMTDFPYDDILDAPHHVSTRHPQMSMHDRAGQFSPFAALDGHGDLLRETARLTEERLELDEDARALLDRRLRDLSSRLAEHPLVTVEHFVPDARKAGGAYGRLTKISAAAGTLTLEDGTRIAFRDLSALEEPSEGHDLKGEAPVSANAWHPA